MKFNDNDKIWVVTRNLDNEEMTSKWSVGELKTSWYSDDYDGPCGDDEILTYSINGIIQPLNTLPINKYNYVDFSTLLSYLGIDKRIYNYKPGKNDMEMWLICHALGEASEGNGYHLIDNMERNDEGSLPVEFKVGGVPLDFGLVAEHLDKSLNDMINREATNIFIKKCNNIISELENIEDNVSDLSDEIFKYNWKTENSIAKNN